MEKLAARSSKARLESRGLPRAATPAGQHGGLEQLIDKLPGLKPEQLAAAKSTRSCYPAIGIIDSCDPAERRQPDLIDGSRKRRIAAGAGLPIQEVAGC